MLQKRKKLINEKIQINSIKPETWTTTYFRNLFDSEELRDDDDENFNLHTINEEAENTEIKMEKVQKIIFEPKNRKAPGIDNLSNARQIQGALKSNQRYINYLTK